MTFEKINNIVVVGAGFAGCISALFAKELFPKANITIVGSRAIGILGAGEGTIPVIRNFLRFINIDLLDLFRECKSTFKFGIRFENWRGDNKFYYHNFHRIINNQLLLQRNRLLGNDMMHYLDYQCFINDHDSHHYDYTDLLQEQRKVPFNEHNAIEMHDKLDNWFAYHFDAAEITKYLEKIAISRGINFIDAKVTSFDADGEEYINKINMEDGSIDCDFVFDCSGLRRLIIGEFYKNNSSWVDLTKYLTVNRAIPFVLPPDENPKNYTTATAMNNGWVWQIPLQHRNGCGYVFNSKFCDDEIARKELREKFGEQIEIPKSFSFNAGYYEKPWIKNCIAIGLSTGFVEPLEATSIWVSSIQLVNLTRLVPYMYKADQSIIDLYNRDIVRLNEHVSSFIQYHYLSDRKDTEFWRDITSKDIMPANRLLVETWKHRMPIETDSFKIQNFALDSWIKVGLGNGFFSKQKIIDHYEYVSNRGWGGNQTFMDFESMKRHQLNTLSKKLQNNITQRKFLEIVVGKEKLEENRKLIFK